MSNHDVSLPSGRIRFALEAMRRFEEQGGHLDMIYFHAVKNGTCFACMGGAAALMYYDVPPERWHVVGDTDDFAYRFCIPYDEISNFECSLESARTGAIAGMFEEMGLDRYEGERFNRVPFIRRFDVDRKGFEADMIRLANDLEKAGY